MSARCWDILIYGRKIRVFNTHIPTAAHIHTPLAAQYDDSPEALAAALDSLLEDPEFLDAVADEVRSTRPRATGSTHSSIDLMFCQF